jgi:choline dehydrogenase-like flavoprotein
VEPSGSAAEVRVNGLIAAFQSRGFNIKNLNGQPFVEPDGVYRPHFIFDENDKRTSPDTLLDRDNPLLEIRLGTRVERVLFDGDLGVSIFANDWMWFMRSKPRARCVRFTSLDTACVKSNGRIYLSAGTFYTPALLMKSGIGPSGRRSKLPDVGKNLSDKPAYYYVTNFQPSFNYKDQITVANLVATQKVTASNGKSSVIMLQESSYGFPSLLSALLFSRGLIPRSARNSLFGTGFELLGDVCGYLIERYPVLSQACLAAKTLSDAGCDSRAGAMVGFLSEPTSKGSVELASGDKIKVRINLLDTPEDREILGVAGRRMFEVLSSVQGPAAPQQPCPPNNSTCAADSCPRLLAEFTGLIKTGLKVINPTAAKDIPDNLSQSVVSPNWVEKILSKSNDPVVVGDKLAPFTFPVWHTCGTASIGKVVSERFAVYGIDGLYVADGSVIPMTTKGNLMATATMMGRLAGVRYLEDIA